MGVVGDFFIAIGKDRGNYNWKRKEEGRRTADDGLQRMNDKPLSTDNK